MNPMNFIQRLRKYAIEILLVVVFYYFFAVVNLYWFSGEFKLNIFKSKSIDELLIVSAVTIIGLFIYRIIKGLFEKKDEKSN